MNHVIIKYKNWRGEVGDRRIVPPNGQGHFRVYRGSNSWHPEPTWLFDALDLDRGCIRTFAVSGIQSWQEGNDFSKSTPEHDRGSGV